MLVAVLVLGTVLGILLVVLRIGEIGIVLVLAVVAVVIVVGHFHFTSLLLVLSVRKSVLYALSKEKSNFFVFRG